MQNTMGDFFKMQFIFVDSAMKMTVSNLQIYERLIHKCMKWSGPPSFARLADWIPSGASWFDHYGNRSHDVDVEKV